ncbi:MAG: DUF4112 domain-containing protein [Myxococcota bacterium]
MEADDREQLERTLARLQRLARLMDDQFELPIIKKRVGLDPLIGLIPGAGDWATWLVSVYIFWEALRLGASTSLLVRMAANVTVDLVAGYVPAVGDVVDAAFKANKRNVDLLFKSFGVRQVPGTDRVEVGRESRIRRAKGAGRWVVGGLLLLGLLAIAAAPFVLVGWFIGRS